MPEVLVRSHTTQDPDDKRRMLTVEDYRVEIVDKPEETRAIFLISGPAAFEGGPPRTLTAQEEEIAALKEKMFFEQAKGGELYHFHRDPLAGGLRAVRQPTEQMYRAGDVREEVFAVPPSGQFKPNPETGERMGAISQGRVGPIIEERRPSNIRPGNATMVPTAGWVGEYL